MTLTGAHTGSGSSRRGPRAPAGHADPGRNRPRTPQPRPPRPGAQRFRPRLRRRCQQPRGGCRHPLVSGADGGRTGRGPSAVLGRAAEAGSPGSGRTACTGTHPQSPPPGPLRAAQPGAGGGTALALKAPRAPRLREGCAMPSSPPSQAQREPGASLRPHSSWALGPCAHARPQPPRPSQGMPIRGHRKPGPGRRPSARVARRPALPARTPALSQAVPPLSGPSHWATPRVPSGSPPRPCPWC